MKQQKGTDKWANREMTKDIKGLEEEEWEGVTTWRAVYATWLY